MHLRFRHMVGLVALGCVLAMACTDASTSAPDAARTCDEAEMMDCCGTLLCPWEACPTLCAGSPDTCNLRSMVDPVGGRCSDADPQTACLVDSFGTVCCGPCDASTPPMLFGDAAYADADALADAGADADAHLAPDGD